MFQMETVKIYQDDRLKLVLRENRHTDLVSPDGSNQMLFSSLTLSSCWLLSGEKVRGLVGCEGKSSFMDPEGKKMQ